jgi:alpha-tubulin suppressor-like RCC1 family protein
VDVISVALNSIHSCAVRMDGRVACWGDNSAGQLGDGGATRNRDLPGDVPGLGGVAGLALGSAHTCAWLRDGTARCWGANMGGQLGTGTTVNSPSPVPVVGLTGVVQMALGTHSCARRSDGTVRCWGFNHGGQLGDGTTVMFRTSPGAVPGLAGVAEIAVGDVLSAAVCGFGPLGDGTTTARNRPGPVPGLMGVAQIALGQSHGCARLMDGTVRCWGANTTGQLGDGTRTNRPTPTVVPGLSGVVHLALGGGHTCARLTDGAVRCWGANTYGQVGDGSTTNREAPTPVLW